MLALFLHTRHVALPVEQMPKHGDAIAAGVATAALIGEAAGEGLPAGGDAWKRWNVYGSGSAGAQKVACPGIGVAPGVAPTGVTWITDDDIN